MKVIYLFSLLICAITANGNDLPSFDNGRIVGGDLVTIDRYPFAAVMLFNSAGTVWTQECGATILTQTALLSSASCYTENNRAVHNVALWQTRVGSSYASTGGVTHNLRLIVRHPNFNQNTLIGDISILRTVTNIVFIPGTVAQGAIAGTAYNLPANQPVVAIGWGLTAYGGSKSDQLRSVEIFTVSETDCVDRYEFYGRPYVIDGNVVCSGWLDMSGRDQCEGDFGGPLLHHGAVVGVQYWKPTCGDPATPTLNTRVSSFTDWIVSTARA